MFWLPDVSGGANYVPLKTTVAGVQLPAWLLLTNWRVSEIARCISIASCSSIDLAIAQ